jgi:hypothetical protein
VQLRDKTGQGHHANAPVVDAEGLLMPTAATVNIPPPPVATIGEMIEQMDDTNDINNVELSKYSQDNWGALPIDENGIQERWTEDYVIRNKEDLQTRLPNLKKVMDGMHNKIFKQNAPYVHQLLNEDQDNDSNDGATNNQPVVNEMVNTKWFCNKCWIRYFRKTEHSRDQCLETQNIRKIAMEMEKIRL